MVHQETNSQAPPLTLQSAVVRAVERARAAGTVLCIGEVAKKIRVQNPHCQFASSQIADLLARKAITAGVPIQFTSPD